MSTMRIPDQRAVLDKILEDLREALPTTARHNLREAAEYIGGELPKIADCFTRAGFVVPSDLLGDTRVHLATLAKTRPKAFAGAASDIRMSLGKFIMRFGLCEQLERAQRNS